MAGDSQPVRRYRAVVNITIADGWDARDKLDVTARIIAHDRRILLITRRWRPIVHAHLAVQWQRMEKRGREFWRAYLYVLPTNSSTAAFDQRITPQEWATALRHMRWCDGCQIECMPIG